MFMPILRSHKPQLMQGIKFKLCEIVQHAGTVIDIALLDIDLYIFCPSFYYLTDLWASQMDKFSAR
jgi:hypothetical protein